MQAPILSRDRMGEVVRILNYPPMEYIGLGGGTNRAVLISWPIHFAPTELAEWDSSLP